MRAIDTNVLARFLLNDDPVQAAEAQHILTTPIFIPVTVLLELGWLLATRFRLERHVIAEALTALLDLPAVTVADPDRIGWALARYRDGGDFADLVHLAAAGSVEAFVTFDQGIAVAAGSDSPVPVETLG